MVNFSQVQLSTKASPTSRLVAGSYALVPGAVCIELVGARVGKKDPIHHTPWIYALITD